MPLKGRKFKNISVVKRTYDGLEQSSELTRIEAFMHQAKEHARRKRKL
jgi:hypothetical protein